MGDAQQQAQQPAFLNAIQVLFVCSIDWILESVRRFEANEALPKLWVDGIRGVVLIG
jgi:hypothetical protein